MRQERILVDAYNFIHQIPHLKAMIRRSLEMAREELIQEFLQYSDHADKEVWLVFDSNRSRSSSEDLFSSVGFKVVFTEAGQTADSFIERAVYQNKDGPMRVVSSDRKIQDIALGKGVFVTTPQVFHEEMRSLRGE